MAATEQKKKVLVTGAEGVIGTAVREFLSDKYDLYSLTLNPQGFPSHVGNVADFEQIRPAFDGMDAVVHLAASADIETPWNDVLNNNLIGTYNVFEAARQAGARTVVFASSNHAMGMYEIDGKPELYEIDDPRTYDHTVEIRPDSLYGVSKAYGEALGRFYVEMHGMRVVCLRIGAVRGNDNPFAPEILTTPRPLIEPLTPDQRKKRMAAMWLSRRDSAQLIEKSIDADHVPWAIVYGISNNARQFLDITLARELLGYEPQDGATP